MDVLVLKKFWGKFDKRAIWLLVPSAALGVVIGYISAGSFNEDNARLLVGVIAILFGVRHFITAKAVASNGKADTAKGLFWGTIAGFTSFHVHSGGPPVAAYLLPKKLPPLLYTGTTGVFFGIVNWIKLPAFFASGQLSQSSLLVSLVLLPFVPIGVKLGYYFAKRIDIKAYYSIISYALILMGIYLIYVALT